MSQAFQPREPDQKALVTINRVEQKDITKQDGTQFRLFEIFVNEQSEAFSTTKKDVAESAYSLIGQVSEITYAVKVKGNYTNYYLNNVLPGPVNPAVVAQRAAEAQPVLAVAAQLPAPAALLQAPPTASQNIPPITTSSSATPIIPVNTSKDEAIHRQVAAKVAATLYAASPEGPIVFWQNVEKLAHYFDTGDFPQRSIDQEDDSIPFDVRIS